MNFTYTKDHLSSIRLSGIYQGPWFSPLVSPCSPLPAPLESGGPWQLILGYTAHSLSYPANSTSLLETLMIIQHWEKKKKMMKYTSPLLQLLITRKLELKPRPHEYFSVRKSPLMSKVF